MRTVSDFLAGIPPLYANLAKILSGSVTCSHQALRAYSTDGSPYSVRPQAVIYPKHATDIKHVISFSREYNIPITVRGYGGARTGGSLGEGIILDMTQHFTHIRQVNMLDHTITVDAGVSIKTLREKLHAWNLDIPILISEGDASTIGGFVSTKSATPSTFHHGTIREWVEALTVVVDTGEEHRIADGITPSGRLLGIYQSIFPILSECGPILRAEKPENNDDATGYCLWNTSIGPRQLLDQLVGGEGTLGIITSVTLRVVPMKKHSITTCIPITNTSLLPTCIDIARHHLAEHIFLYDATFAMLTEKYHQNLLPSFSGTSHVLLVTHYHIDKEKLHSQVRTFIRALPIPQETLLQVEGDSLLGRVTKTDFLYSLFDSYTRGSYTPITVADGIIVPLHLYDELLKSLDSYLSSLGSLYVITGNAGSGHISIVTLFDPRTPTYETSLSGYTEAVFGLVKKYKGGISAVSGDGLSRTPYMAYAYNEQALTVFKKIKEAWDPKMILNPGKKISITTHYLHEHLIHNT
jgi:FAD/FMN-containing dehydrogenase